MSLLNDILVSLTHSPIDAHINMQQEGVCSTAKVRRNFKFYITVVLFFLSFTVGLTIIVNGTEDSTSGTNVMLGNSDVVLVTQSNSSTRIEISSTSIMERTGVDIYQNLCSEIRQLHQVSKDTREVTVFENMTYSIEEVYLIGTSRVDYNFTNAGSQASIPCVAYIFIFLNYSKYVEFLSSGYANDPSEAYCLSSNEPLHFQLNSSNRDSYRFVGLKSFESTTLNYTVSKDLLKYDITDEFRHTCTITTSLPACSLISTNFQKGQEVCFLASLRFTHAFINLSYKVYFPGTIWVLGLVIFTCVPFFIVSIPFNIMISAIDSTRKCRHYYHCEYLDKTRCCECLVFFCSPVDHWCHNRCTLCHRCNECCYDSCISNIC